MTEEEGSGPMSPDVRRKIENRLLALLQKQIQDKEIVLTRATRRDEVIIDSIDIVHVIFAFEVEFGAIVDLSTKVGFATVGDLLDAFISFIPNTNGMRI